MRRPRGAGHKIAIDNCFGHCDFSKRATRARDFRRARGITTDLLPFQDTRSGEHLRTMAERSNRLVRGSKVTNNLQYSRVQANIFRSAAARNDQGVVILRLYVVEGGIKREIVAALFGVGLVTLKIVNRGAYGVAGFLAGARGVTECPTMSSAWNGTMTS